MGKDLLRRGEQQLVPDHMVGTAIGRPGRARRQYLGCGSGRKEAAAVRSGYKKAGSCRNGSSGGVVSVLIDAVLNMSWS